MSKIIPFMDDLRQEALAQVVESGYAVSEVAEPPWISRQITFSVESTAFKVTAT
jgi:hypothetical protein